MHAVSGPWRLVSGSGGRHVWVQQTGSEHGDFGSPHDSVSSHVMGQKRQSRQPTEAEVGRPLH